MQTIDPWSLGRLIGLNRLPIHLNEFLSVEEVREQENHPEVQLFVDDLNLCCVCQLTADEVKTAFWSPCMSAENAPYTCDIPGMVRFIVAF